MLNRLLAAVALLIALPAHAQTVWGVNGHEGRADYPASTMEQRMQMLQAAGLKTYRTDVGTNSTAVMDKLVPLAARYGVTLRPMLYPDSQANVSAFVSRYPTVPVWEIGNEMDLTARSNWQANIYSLMPAYRAVKQAGKKASINIVACNNDAGSGSQCEGLATGDVAFLDMAKASGFAFDFVTFHYYPRVGDRGYWMNKYLGQMRAAASKYGVKIFLNEANCGEIYDGNTDGTGNCVNGLKVFLDTVKASYSDIVAEVNLYEMLDEPTSAPAGTERYFGLRTNMATAKPTWTLLATYGAPPAPTCTPGLIEVFNNGTKTYSVQTDAQTIFMRGDGWKDLGTFPVCP